MPGHRPEYHRQRDCARSDKDRHPDRTPEQKLLDVRLADVEGAEWRGLGLAEKYEHGIKLVLMGNEEEYGKSIWDEELYVCS